VNLWYFIDFFRQHSPFAFVRHVIASRCDIIYGNILPKSLSMSVSGSLLLIFSVCRVSLLTCLIIIKLLHERPALWAVGFSWQPGFALLYFVQCSVTNKYDWLIDCRRLQWPHVLPQSIAISAQIVPDKINAWRLNLQCFIVFRSRCGKAGDHSKLMS